jgi:hypothetical protein
MFPIDYVVGELTRPTPLYLVPSREEVAQALIDVVVDTPECRPVRPIS